VVVNAARGRAAQTPARVPGARPSEAIVWHDLECGSYRADLPLWRELAASARPAAPARLLEIGSGTGRVALALAREGHHVTALDRDAELLRALSERAATAGLGTLETVCADARTFALEREDYAACLVPMQTLQLLGAGAGRRAFLRRARAHLRTGGLLACAIVTEVEPFDCTAGELGPSPDVVRVGGASYVSRPTRVRIERRVVRIERERSIVVDARAGASGGRRAGAPRSPAPAARRDVVELHRVSVARLRREGREAGFAPEGSREVPATAEHTGSAVVMFRA